MTTGPQYTADELRAVIDQVEAAKAAQPEKLRQMRAQAREAREAATRDEPWDSLWSALPAVDAQTGELTGMLALPSIDAKELFGTRLAFELATYAGDRDQVDEITNWYFSEIREPDHLFLVAMAALKTMSLYVLPSLLEMAEEGANCWNYRVMLADAARNAWEKRINADDNAGGA